MSHIFGKGESFILQLCCCYTLKKMRKIKSETATIFCFDILYAYYRFTKLLQDSYLVLCSLNICCLET